MYSTYIGSANCCANCQLIKDVIRSNISTTIAPTLLLCCQVWWLYKGRYNNAENFTSVATEGSAESLVREGVFIVNAGFGHVTWNNIRWVQDDKIETSLGMDNNYTGS